MVKKGRLAKGYTQKELSERSNISVRSIQRIENAELFPRSYTLKTLAEILNISFENMQETELPVINQRSSMNRNQKLILSAGITIVILLFSWAFIAQSPRFPETTFELLVFFAIILIIITGILTLIWRKDQK